MKNIDVVRSNSLSTFSNQRYVIVDSETGEIIDDAQGYGYKTKRNAYAAYGYKHRDKSKDKEKKEKEEYIIAWMHNHEKFMDEFSAEVDVCEFLIAKGEFDDKPYRSGLLEHMLKEYNLEIDFSKKDFLRVWQKY